MMSSTEVQELEKRVSESSNKDNKDDKQNQNGLSAKGRKAIIAAVVSLVICSVGIVIGLSAHKNKGSKEAALSSEVSVTDTSSTVEDEPATEGKCGENVTWTLDENGLLELKGSGDMDSFTSHRSTPWYDLIDKIKEVRMDDTITSISSYAFYKCENLQVVEVGKGVTEIGSSAFAYCSDLTKVVIPENVKQIVTNAFDYDNKITIYCTKDSKAINIAKTHKYEYKLTEGSDSSSETETIPTEITLEKEVNLPEDFKPEKFKYELVIDGKSVNHMTLYDTTSPIKVKSYGTTGVELVEIYINEVLYVSYDFDFGNNRISLSVGPNTEDVLKTVKDGDKSKNISDSDSKLEPEKKEIGYSNGVYVANTFSFKIDEKKWKVDSEIGKNILFRYIGDTNDPLAGISTINIIIEKIPGTENVDENDYSALIDQIKGDLKNGIKQKYATMDNVKNLKIYDEKLSGKDIIALKMDYLFEDQKAIMCQKEWITKDGVCVLTYGTIESKFDEMQPEFDDVLNSLVID